MMKRLLAALAVIFAVAAISSHEVRAQDNKLTVIVFPGVQNLPMFAAQARASTRSAA